MDRATLAFLFVSIFAASSAAGEVAFTRGDTNGDGVLDIADAANAAAAAGGGWLPCPDAADATDDGRIDVRDVLQILNVSGGRLGELPPPWELPGLDPTPDKIPCLIPPAYEPQEAIGTEVFLSDMESDSRGVAQAEISVTTDRPLVGLSFNVRIDGIENFCLSVQKRAPVALFEAFPSKPTVILLSTLHAKAYVEPGENILLGLIELALPEGVPQGRYTVRLENVKAAFPDERASFSVFEAESVLSVPEEIIQGNCPAEKQGFSLKAEGPSRLPEELDSFQVQVLLDAWEQFQTAQVALDFSENILALKDIKLAGEGEGQLSAPIKVTVVTSDTQSDGSGVNLADHGFVVLSVKAPGEGPQRFQVNLATLAFEVLHRGPAFPWAKVRFRQVGKDPGWNTFAVVKRAGGSTRIEPNDVQDLVVLLSGPACPEPQTPEEVRITCALETIQASPGQSEVPLKLTAEGTSCLAGLSLAFRCEGRFLRFRRIEPALDVFGEEPEILQAGIWAPHDDSEPRGAFISFVADTSGRVPFLPAGRSLLATIIVDVSEETEHGQVIPIVFDDTCCGSPPVVNGVLAGGNFIPLLAPPQAADGMKVLSGAIRIVERLFVRGDATSDDKVDIADAIFILTFLFGGGSPPLCPDAADANDDGRINVSDAVAVLSTLFGNTAAIRPPYPAPGIDETPDDLGSCLR